MQQGPAKVSGLLGRERLSAPSSRAQVTSHLLGSESIRVWPDCGGSSLGAHREQNETGVDVNTPSSAQCEAKMTVQPRLLFINPVKALPPRYIHTPSSSEIEFGWVVQANLEFVILRPLSPESLGLQVRSVRPCHCHLVLQIFISSAGV